MATATGTNSANQDMLFTCQDLTVTDVATLSGAATFSGTQSFTGTPTFTSSIVSSGGITENVATASTATTIAAGGVAVFAATSTEQKLFTLAAPTVGATKTLVSNGASTAQHVALVSGGFQSTNASTSGVAYTHVCFGGVGQYMDLIGISTSLWQVRSDPTANLLATASTVA